MRECEMRPAIVRWLADMGHSPVFEVCVSRFNACDIVGIRFEDRHGRQIPALASLIAVELKVFKAAEVLRQAIANARHASVSYAAMPTATCELFKRSTILNFARAGIGLLAVEIGTGVVTELLMPVASTEPIPDRLRRNLWRRRNEPVRGPKNFPKEAAS